MVRLVFLNFRKLGLFLAVLVMGIMPSHAAAQTQATEEGDARAFLVTPLSFVKQFDLDFGNIVATNTAGTVTMDSAGNVSTTGGVTQMDGSQQPAQFWGFGTFNQTVLINADANSYILTREGGTETMLLDRLLIGSNPPIRINVNPRRFRIANPDGFFAFTIAGRLQVGANQLPGRYVGEFTIQLEYE